MCVRIRALSLQHCDRLGSLATTATMDERKCWAGVWVLCGFASGFFFASVCAQICRGGGRQVLHTKQGKGEMKREKIEHEKKNKRETETERETQQLLASQKKYLLLNDSRFNNYNSHSVMFFIPVGS